MNRNLKAMVRRFWPARGDRDRRALLHRMPSASVCAEIGVWKGDFSRAILEIVRPRTLHLIDPWEFLPDYPTRWYGGQLARHQEDMERIYETITKEFGGRSDVEIHRGYSSSVLSGMADATLDWVYIDGNHSYDFVLRDLELAWAKVREGGFLTGDDYPWVPQGASGEDADGHLPPVQRAITDFMQSRDLALSSLELIGTQFILARTSG